MPGLIRGAVAVGTLPFSLSTKFAESHAVQMDMNEYHDGSSQRTSLVTGGRRSWKIAKRLDALHLGLLRNFFDANLAKAFYFYNPSETLPRYSHAPDGTSGRYLVRFASDWEQTAGMSRSDTAIEVIELASDADMAAASSVTNAAVPLQTTMYAITSHYPNSSFTPSIGVEISTSPIGLFDPADWIQSTAQWDARTDSKAFSPTSWGGSVLFGLNTNSGSVSGLDPTDQLWVYDCWYVQLYGDGSTQILRPTIAEPITNAAGGVTNPVNAIDGDPTSYAVVYRTAYSPLSVGNYLALRKFA